jgi:CBS-domain-containing membrane protein
MSLWFAVALGPLTQPWGLVGAGVATIVAAKLSSWESYVALFAFCVLSTSTYLAMEIYATLRPDNTQAFLTRTRVWIETHTDVVIVFLSLGLGFWLVGKSIYLLVS